MTDDLLVQSRSALLDALEALAEHRDAVVIIGAQAIYLRTPDAPVALAEATKDSDLALDPRLLRDSPLIEEAMTAAGFIHNPTSNQPGAWQNAYGIPVDLMVPEDLAGPGSKERVVRGYLRTRRTRCVVRQGLKQPSSTTRPRPSPHLTPWTPGHSM